MVMVRRAGALQKKYVQILGFVRLHNQKFIFSMKGCVNISRRSKAIGNRNIKIEQS